VLLCLKTETELASERPCFFKKVENGQSPKKRRLSVAFSHALFSLLFTNDDLVMQALVWLHRVWLRVIWCGISYANLR